MAINYQDATSLVADAPGGVHKMGRFTTLERYHRKTFCVKNRGHVVVAICPGKWITNGCFHPSRLVVLKIYNKVLPFAVTWNPSIGRYVAASGEYIIDGYEVTKEQPRGRISKLPQPEEEEIAKDANWFKVVYEEDELAGVVVAPAAEV